MAWFSALFDRLTAWHVDVSLILTRSTLLRHIGSHNSDNGQMRHISILGNPWIKSTTAAFVVAGLLAGCSPTLNSHGNIPNAELIQSIRIGSSNREQISAMLGNPSTVATFDKESWYYVGMRTSQIAFLEPEILERRVLVIRFDKQGIVQQVERLDKQDGRNVQIVDRKTPTRGKELTILEQLLGNVGKFSGPEVDDGSAGL
ncbi:MAG: outer membrane protein assembly factor BamE (lipoprotein component of BamABCDE complex) [Paracoccaceae bacterium]|jgi:outer membrane protein assembly factor BamE (lipoprotein component of BamABCDE complex)